MFHLVIFIRKTTYKYFIGLHLVILVQGSSCATGHLRPTFTNIYKIYLLCPPFINSCLLRRYYPYLIKIFRMSMFLSIRKSSEFIVFFSLGFVIKMCRTGTSMELYVEKFKIEYTMVYNSQTH